MDQSENSDTSNTSPSIQPPVPPATAPSPGDDMPPQTPVAKPSPTTSPTSSVMPARLLPDVPSRKPSRKILIVLGVIILLGGGVGVSAAKLFWYDPLHAPTALFEKMIDAKTGQYSANISYKSQAGSASFLGDKITVSATGSYDVTDEDKPKSANAFKIALGQFKIAADMITVPKTIYFKLSNSDFLSGFGLQLGTSWYKYPLSEDTSKDKCKQTRTKSGSFMGVTLPKDVPLKDTSRVGLYETIDGHMTSHYKGTVDLDKLVAHLKEVNKELPAECKIDFGKEDIKNLEVTYEMWRGKDFDRLEAKIVSKGEDKSTTTLTIDTKAYNKSVSIVEPKDAKLFDLFGAESTGTGGEGSSSADAQRKSDLRNVKVALETYYNDNNAYPAAKSYTELRSHLTTGPTPYMKQLPADPANNGAHIYVYKVAADRQTYTLSATLDNTKDMQAPNGAYTIQSAN
ncbi:MAG TPA: type II secretion system protein GspG [Candidatus Saccharimonadia bacterium]